ncbi:MAG: hypothetical protein R3357_09895 [Burkholderiales bacterium]|nr:hypothetical protein [Burkholderiales bacterium]
METKWFGSYESGLVFRIDVEHDAVADKTTFKVTVLEGSLDLNAVYWGDGNATAGESGLQGDWLSQTTKKGTVDAGINDDGSMTFAGADNALNMNGVDAVWDGGIKLSNAGLGPEDEGTFSDNWDTDVDGNPCYSFCADGDITAFLATLGVRATSTSTEEGGEGSIKWIGSDEPPVPPQEEEDHFPDFKEVWGSDISNVVLYFDADTTNLVEIKQGVFSNGDTNPVDGKKDGTGQGYPNDLADPIDGDGYYTVKIDNWPGGASDDLDDNLDEILAYLIATDPYIGDDTVLLGASIKGGQEEHFYALDNNHDEDPVPGGVFINTGNDVDASVLYSVIDNHPDYDLL